MAARGNVDVGYNPEDSEITHFWYTYDICGRLATWFSDDNYIPQHSEIRHVYSRGVDESLESFKARCQNWEISDGQVE